MRIMNTNLFIEKSKRIHDDFYNYGKSVYVSNKTMIIITCPEHGDFAQTPNNHLSGYGCIKCSIVSRKNKRKMNDFIEVSRSKFFDKFNYDEVEYINNATNIKLMCNFHGEIYTTPSVHLKSKTGCPKCSTENAANSQKSNLDDLIFRFNEKHKNRYNYEKVDYISCNKKIEIICNKHGSFWQSSKQHLRGDGCPNCYISNGEYVIYEYLKQNNIEFKNEHIFIDCIYKRPLKFDFYLPNNRIAIEFDGIQHFKPVDIFGGEKAYNLQLIKDHIKNNYCVNNHIKLYRIKYSDIIEEKLTLILNEI